MKFKKQQIILVLTVLSIVAILVLMVSRGSDKMQTVPIEVSKPNIPEYLLDSTNIPIKLAVSSDDFNFPTTLPVLNIKYSAPVSNKEARDVARNLGFTNDPLEVNDIVEGITYLWQDSKQELTIYSKSRRINYVDYTKDDLQSGKEINENEIIANASNFLTNQLELASARVKFSNFTYIYKNPDSFEFELNYVPKRDANIYQANFSYKIADTKIVTLRPEDSPIFVQLLPDGTIIYASVFKFGAIEKSPQEYQLKNLDSVRESINRAIVISLDKGRATLQEIDSSEISQIVIDEIELAYVLDSLIPNSLKPVYILSGIATYTNNNQVDVSLYLPAFLGQ
jgi:hypothetical protein